MRATVIIFTFFLTLLLVGCGTDQQSAGSQLTTATKSSEQQAAEPAVTPKAVTQPRTTGKPKMLEFGSKKCQACKSMEPVMANLKASHSEVFEIDFIDVWIPANQMFAKSYNIMSIPTQVFLDADGKEVFRHLGYFSEEDILAKWREVGVDVDAQKSSNASASGDEAAPNGADKPASEEKAPESSGNE